MDTQGLKIDVALICDDIRMEANGKAILIGVYAGDILLNHMPATIPVSLWLEGQVHGDPGKLNVNIYLGDEAIESGDITDWGPIKRGENGEFFLALNGLMVNITKPTTITVRIKKNQDEWVIATRKKVVLPPPNSLSSSETPQLS